MATHGSPCGLAEFAQHLCDLALAFKPRLRDLEEEVVLAEQFAEAQRGIASPLQVVLLDRGGDLRGDRARQRDQTLAVVLQHFEVDARAVAQALEPRAAREFLQVVEALVVRRQQRQVEGRVVGAGRLLARLAGDVGRLPDDGFDLLAFAGLEELDGAEQVAVVGQRHRGLAVRGRRGDEIADLRRGREQAVVRAHMQVAEGGASLIATSRYSMLRSAPTPT